MRPTTTADDAAPWGAPDMTSGGRALEGKVALVTGAGRGIGAAVARAFHAAGATVVGVDRDRPAAPPPWELCTADVTDSEAMSRLLQDATLRHGAIDCLVNNAGISRRAALGDLRESTWDEVQDVNLKAPVMLLRAALAALADGASVVNISSIRARRGFADDVAYLAAKGGLDAVTRGLAVELAPRGIRVNAVAPGAIDTDLSAPGLADEQTRARVLGRIPLGRLGSADEVAGAVVFLAGPAATFITGSVLVVDGGQTAAG